MSFDTVVMVDWSGGNDRGAQPKKDAIWACLARDGRAEPPIYHRNRQMAEQWLNTTLKDELDAGRRVLVGFDLCFAYPRGFAQHLIGSEDTLALWDWLAERVEDAPDANNRFDLAGEINALFPGEGPFWFNALKREIPSLPRKQKSRHSHGLDDRRSVERAAKGSFSPFQLAGAGAVGGQVIMGLPMLSRLRHNFGSALSVWPFEASDAQIVLAECYFSLVPLPPDGHAIKDAAQVRHYAERFSAMSAADWAVLLDHPADPEGWVLGLGHEALLQGPMDSLTPPPLRNDCFAMPQGAHWTPVDDALAHLRAQLGPVTRIERISTHGAAGRILAEDVIAERSHPPAANSAVDGYGFAGALASGTHQLPLVAGRAAAGQPFDGAVPKGQAVRILTGAILPEGVDTVVLQEDVTAGPDAIALHGPLKRGANARKAGEDMTAGQVILPAGRIVTAADIGTIAAVGVAEVSVRTRLRVGVLSTGDELVQPGTVADDGQIYDANRPMLLASLTRWGVEAIDLGNAPDDRTKLRAILDDAAARTDAIITSGGASGGDEDHMSALLQGTGSFALWRIAVKPGRPLALGLWDGTPVFGLPGNPVAAQVCLLVFARPALALLAGADWQEPEAYMLPAAFTKSKKAGRREFLRARVTDGQVEVFPSEGSGRVSGLSWATGLVVLPDEAVDVAIGDPVTFLPFTGFGL